MVENSPRRLPILVGETWYAPTETAFTPIHNPANGETVAEVPLCTPTEINQAVASASEAFRTWSAVPPVERARYLFRYRAILEEHFEELAGLITSEHGKTLGDARGELRRGLEVVEFACGIPTLLMGENLDDIARGVDGSMIRQPLGVCVGITPFNFPGMIPLWMLPVAIACGNTFILKPSPRTPVTSVRLVELLQQTGLPAGVVNLVHGDKVSVDALLTHPDVKAVSFVGSSDVAKYVYETGAAHGKRVQALGGAKNHLVIMPDCDMEKTVHGILESAFGSGGQRCLAASVVLAVGDVGDELVSRLAAAARNYTVGGGADEGTRMGPMVAPAARDRALRYIEQGVKDGATVALDGRDEQLLARAGGCYIGPTILDHVPLSSALGQEEIFGPVLSVIRVRDLDEAISVLNRTRYGNSACIFTANGKAARTFAQQVDVGMVGINVGVAGPMAFFSFGGHKDSFYGDLRVHGKDGVRFYTSAKSITTRWF